MMIKNDFDKSSGNPLSSIFFPSEIATIYNYHVREIITVVIITIM